MMNLEGVALHLFDMGMTVETSKDEAGSPTVTATIETRRGMIHVLCIAQGARLGKPNGTSKYLYECSEGKLLAVVAQIIRANA